jgi:hypothetical protein
MILQKEKLVPLGIELVCGIAGGSSSKLEGAMFRQLERRLF